MLHGTVGWQEGERRDQRLSGSYWTVPGGGDGGFHSGGGEQWSELRYVFKRDQRHSVGFKRKKGVWDGGKDFILSR